MSTHVHNKTKYYKILINVAFNIFNNGGFPCFPGIAATVR